MSRAWNIATLHYRRISTLTRAVKPSARALFQRLTGLLEDPHLRRMRDTVAPWELLRIERNLRRIETVRLG